MANESQAGDLRSLGIAMRLLRRLYRFLLIVLLMPLTAAAHQSGNSYLRIGSTEAGVSVQIDFAVRDLNSLLQIPPEKQKEIRRHELEEMRDRLAALVGESLVLEADGDPLSLTFQSQEVTVHNDGLYVRQTHTAAALPSHAAYLLVRYGFFNEEEKIARAFLKLNSGPFEATAVLDPRHAIQRLPLREIALAEALWTYAREGALHIWSGPDHLLFLLCLLLPGLSLVAPRATVMPFESIESGTALAPVHSGLNAVGVYALKVVTAFTLSHSITLAAAALDWIALPDKLIESAIAASIIVSALLNLRGGEGRHAWKLALGFGLIHGMGFANGLRELGLSSSHFIETLVAFNLGVEFGQLVVVLAAGLLLWPMLGNERVIRLIQRWGSLGILLMACVWLGERVLG
jgi:HupE / UreJ protein